MDPVAKEELNKGFSAAMSFEDNEARDIAGAIIEEKLKHFAHAPTTYPRKKRKTTFRPNLGAVSEDSASRPPTTSTSTKHTPARRPPPFPKFATSSLPPSSPCPSNTALNINEEELEVEVFPGIGEREAEPSPSAHLEEAAPAERKKKNAKKPKQKPSAAQDLAHEDKEADPKPPQRQSRKGKEKASASTVPQEEDEATSAPRKSRKGKEKAPASPLEQVKDNDEHRTAKKRGRLSKETIKQAHALRQTYHDELEALALKDGKSVAALLSAVGDTVLDSRSLNPWNVFQAYTTHPEGLGMERHEDKSIADFNTELLAAYRKMHAEAEDTEDAFKDIMRWYRKQLYEQTATMQNGGLSDKQLPKIVAPFNAQGRQAYEYYGVSVFGFVIDPVTSHGFGFGADPYSVAMKEGNVAHLPTPHPGQLHDYGALIHLEWMKKKFGEFLDPAKVVIIKRYNNARNHHETLRKILKDVWLLNLNEVAGSKHIKQLQWGCHFADLCYTHKVKLVNYPIGLKPLGVPDGLQGVSGMNIAKHVKPIVKNFVLFWQQEAEVKKSADSSDDEYIMSLYADGDSYDAKKEQKVDEDDLVRFMAWDEDELDLEDMAEEAEIGIVVQEPQGDEEPLVLAKVLHLKKFVRRAAARKVKIQGVNDLSDVGKGESDVAPAQMKKALPAPNRKKRLQVPVCEKAKKGRVVSDKESEADVAPPPPAQKKPKKPKESDNTAPPPPRAPASKTKPKDKKPTAAATAPAPKKPTAAPPAPKTKKSAAAPPAPSVLAKPKKSAMTNEVAPKAGPSKLQGRGGGGTSAEAATG
ncbi:hypothetical protein BDP27DRAFT_1419523 [Rhodocollybia butyracea]|uniref:Uncharacterized protein n=1 Tax=Rhodocollybia butyracea TaxID=206335 RepID=A0A9P5PXD4_9AGAR|nr:hypothetical protein BDP27DRAFT_1419523 [Rhodocollybia butyracea]